MTHHIKTTLRLAWVELENRLLEGFTEVSFGSGPRVNNEQLLSIIAMHHPDGRVVAIERVKTYNGVRTTINDPSETEYTQDEFRKRKNDYQLQLSPHYPIAESLDEYKD
jgi:hypothetical protein